MGGEAVRVYEANQEWPDTVKRALAAHLLSSLRPPPARCLFLGAATGVNDALPFAGIAGPGISVVGSDIEPRFLDRLRERAERERLRNVEARRIDLCEDLGTLGAFDLVTLLFVIHRLAEWRPVVQPLADLVAPGGSLHVSEFAGPSGLIYLSNEGGGGGADPVSRMIRRYFELLPSRFDAPLRSTWIRPVREALANCLRPAGFEDFVWTQRLTPGEMWRRIAARAYAPYFSTHAPAGLLAQLRREFERDWREEVTLEETIRVYRFSRPPAPPPHHPRKED
jgi:SAM-dependent methyltransferase